MPFPQETLDSLAILVGTTIEVELSTGTTFEGELLEGAFGFIRIKPLATMVDEHRLNPAFIARITVLA